MNYTDSDANVVDSGTSQRMHQSSLPVPTEVSAKDMNMVIWSLMEIVKAAGLSGLEFDAGAPETYGLLLKSMNLGFVRGETGKPLKMIAMCVRNTGSGWARLEDVDHTSVGAGAISVTGGGRLRTGLGFTADKVVALLGCGDETYSAMGLLLGATVGVDYADWQLSMPLSCWAEKTIGGGSHFEFGDINACFGPGTNTTIADEPDGSGFTITHGGSGDSVVPVCMVLREAGGVSATGVDCRLSYGADTVTVTACEDFSGYIYYNGSAWVVDTPNIAKPTVNFSAGVLTVTHEDLGTDGTALHVSAISGVYHAYSSTVITGTSFAVSFYNYAGAPVNVANADMKLRYSRPRKVLTKAPEGMRVAISRGPVALHADDVSSVNGNLWLIGLMMAD